MTDGGLAVAGPEYGTSEAAWKGVLVEADRLSDVHLKIREFLCNDVTNQVRDWQRANYTKVSASPFATPSLSSFTEFYLVLLNFTRFYSILPGFTQFYLVLLSFTWLYLVLLNFTWFFSVLPGFT